MDPGSILGLSALRPSLLVNVSSAESREGQACLGVQLMTHRPLVLAAREFLTNIFRIDDDVDDDVDDDDDFGDDDDEDDEDEDEGDDEEPETWQVSLKGGPGLTSGIELPRLAGICQLS
jgi:hypothetical protein